MLAVVHTVFCLHNIPLRSASVYMSVSVPGIYFYYMRSSRLIYLNASGAHCEYRQFEILFRRYFGNFALKFLFARLPFSCGLISLLLKARMCKCNRCRTYLLCFRQVSWDGSSSQHDSSYKTVEKNGQVIMVMFFGFQCDYCTKAIGRAAKFLKVCSSVRCRNLELLPL